MARRPISPALLGKAALRIGARQAESDLGLALASLGVVLAGLRDGPVPVRLPELATLSELIPPEHRPHAAAILATAHGLVDWLATHQDAILAEAPPAGSA